MPPPRPEVPYSAFHALARARGVRQAVLVEAAPGSGASTWVHFSSRDRSWSPPGGRAAAARRGGEPGAPAPSAGEFRARVPRGGLLQPGGAAAALLQGGAEFRASPPDAGLAARAALARVAPLCVGLGLALWLSARRFKLLGRGGFTAGAALAAGRQGAQGFTFRDVRGLDSAIVELAEVVELLRRGPAGADGVGGVASRGGRLLGQAGGPPRGVLLCGPPGTGKTLLARAVAGEAGVPFFAVSGSEFLEMFVGVGAARIRELFAAARRAARESGRGAVVFVDEVDAVGGARGLGLPGASSEKDQALNQLLTELDGFLTTPAGEPPVVTLAATNRADALDPALTRPGRLSRRVTCGLPSRAGRASILELYLADVALEKDLGRGLPLGLDLGVAGRPEAEAAAGLLALATPGFSGAELASVVSEAGLLARRAGQECIGLAELLEGARRTRFGVSGAGG